MTTTKIFELRTQGYDKVISELNKLEEKFRELKLAKAELEVTKLTSKDALVLKANTEALGANEIALKKNLAKRLEMDIEIRSLLSIRQKEIDQLKVEAGSYNDVLNQLQKLQAAKRNLSPTGGSTISVTNRDGSTSNYNYAQATAQVQTLTQRLQELNGVQRQSAAIGQQVTNGMAAGFQKLKGQVGSFLLTYVGVYAALRQVGNLVSENVKLSDSFADLQIRLHGTKEEVETLFEALKKIDTRTSLKDLVDISNIIAKKGVPKEDIAALTVAFDRLNVVLGKELGEPGTATANIIKLITIFNDDKKVTVERVNELATSLFKLTTSGVATGEFIVNFAERVGAVRGITGLAAQDIFGLGAALQQLGQRVELSSTAVIQLTTKMFNNVPKWAKAANLTTEAFSKLLETKPSEALLAVAENLKKTGETLDGVNFEEIVQAFNDVGVTGARIKAVLGDLATNASFVRDRIKQASVSMSDYGNQTAAAELKQHTFAATIDRVRKEFEKIGTSKGVNSFLKAFADLILLVVQNLGLIVGALTTYAAAWVLANGVLVIINTSLFLNRIALTLQAAYLTVATVASNAYAAALGLIERALIAVGVSSTIVRTLMGPLVAIFAVIVGSSIALYQAWNKVSVAVDEYRRRQNAANEVARLAAVQIAENTSKLRRMYEAATDANIPLEISIKLRKNLIDQFPQIFKGMNAETVSVNELAKAYNNAIIAIRALAFEKAAGKLAAEAEARVADVAAIEILVANAYANRGKKLVVALDKLPNDILAELDINNSQGNSLRAYGNKASFLVYDFPKIMKALEELRKSRELTADQFETLREKYSKADPVTGAPLDKAEPGRTIEAIKQDIKETEDALNQAIINSAKFIELRKKLADLEEELKKAQGKTDKPYRGARLPGDEKDELSIIEANRRAALAIREKEYADIQLTHVLTLAEEQKYIEDIRDINTKYLDQKIAFLEKQKDKNAKELEVLAGFKKEESDILLKAQKDIQALFDKEFTFKKDTLKEKLQQDIADLKEALKTIEEDPSKSFTDKAQAKLDSDTKILALQKQFNIDIDKLEDEYNQRSKANSKETARDILATLKALIEDQKNLRDAEIKDINQSGENIKTAWEIVYAKIRQSILDNDRITARKRAKQLEKLEQEENYSLALAEYRTAALAFQKIKKLYDQALVDEKTFLEAKKRMEDAFEGVQRANKGRKKGTVGTPSDSNTQDLAAGGLSKLFGFEEGSPEDQMLAYTVAYAWDTAKQVMNDYFTAERNRIQDNLKLYEERLDMEKQQVIARASSQAEIDSIEKQYAAKKLKAQREAGEQLKKSKRSEAKIAFLTELANIWSTVWQLGPIVGSIFGIVLSGLATLRYGSTVSGINKEKFEKGGMVPLKGGRFGGETHARGGTQFGFKGAQYEAEVDELAIIRTRNANRNKIHTITGNHEQIASMLNYLGGGTSFKPGARVFADGGLLGSNYTAPIFRPTTVASNSDFDNFRNDIIRLTMEQSKRIDRLQVIQVTSTISDALHKETKQSNIGSL